MTTVAIPSGLADGQTATAGHVTPVYNFLNGANLDDGNVKPGGLTDASLGAGSVNLGTVGKLNSLLPGNVTAPTTGSVSIAAGGADSTITHNRGRAVILGVSAGIAASAGAQCRVVNLKSQGANSFTIGENPATDIVGVTTANTFSAVVGYTYF